MNSLKLTEVTRIVKQPGVRDRLYQRSFYLKLKKSARWSKPLRFSGDSVTVGSSKENDFVISDASVSRHHARISVLGEYLTISDLASTNGICVNGVRILQSYLPDESTIRFGSVAVRFKIGEDSDELELSESDRFGDFIGISVAARHLFSQLSAFAKSNATVLLEGESGTGKEVLARALHNHSERRDQPFVTVDCGSLSPGLFESELFGHVRGAFTGAVKHRAGAFEVAEGGTIFLDEIGELDISLQPKLLRVLEQRQVKKVGGSDDLDVDVRIVAATNRDLHRQMASGGFREDLFYRLAVAHIRVPPLRDRREDIPLLAAHLLDGFRTEYPEFPEFTLSAEAGDSLQKRAWRGNVRELRNVLQLAFLTANVETEMLADESESFMALSEVPTDISYQESRDFIHGRFEQTYIRTALDRTKGNVAKAARECGMDRATLFRLIKKHGIRR